MITMNFFTIPSFVRRFFTRRNPPKIPQVAVYPSAPLAGPSSSDAVAVLFRILSSDLPSKSAGTTAEQLAFILEHEAELPGLQKCWLLHHIADPKQRQALVQLLEHHNQHWQELPFDPLAYANCWTDIGALSADRHPWGQSFAGLSSNDQALVLDYVGRNKSLYLYNANAAANYALRLGWADAPWVFTADSTCFLTPEAWKVIRPLLALPDLAYLAVPSAALDDTQQLLQTPDLPPLAGDTPPLLGFARSDRQPFNPALRQASGAETDLPRRLGLAGPWQHQSPTLGSWELTDITPIPDRGQLVQAGWVYRLPPHPPGQSLEQQDSIRLLARKTDMRLIGEALQRHPLHCWIGLEGADAPTPGLAAIAANARAVPPLSVTDKLELLPGTAERSYVNAVPHWQSLAGSEGSLKRSFLFESAGPICGDVAQHYDRTRLQLMIDCVCALALDGHINGNSESVDHAHRLVRAWFIDPATAMIPDGAYARLSAVDPSRNVLDAAIDFRDLYPFLDAIGLLQRSGRFSSSETQQIEEWFDAFLAWLAEDSASFLRDHSTSPACTWYHLLMLAIAAFRGRKNVAAQVFDNLPGLLAAQFRPDGSPSTTATGSLLRHDQLFNLQAWANLVLLSSVLGRDLLAFNDSSGHGLQVAFDYARRHLPDDNNSTDWLIAMQVISHLDASCTLTKPASIPVLPDASSGLPPFWTLCQPVEVAASICGPST